VWRSLKLLIGADKEVGKWVAAKMPLMFGQEFEKYKAIGVMDSEGKPLAGAVFDEYRPYVSTMQMHLAIDKPFLFSKRIIREVLSYPFETVGVNRLWVAMAHDNEKILRFVEGTGFKKEAVLARHFGNKHAVIARMFKKDFQRIYG
jgi:RimJ/RimL family protein N-acetyltransferase